MNPERNADDNKDEENKELTAAAALTSLVGATVPAAKQGERHDAAKEDEEDETQHEEDDETEQNFDIPQRFTKSGRKRAIPFPLKLMKVLCCKEYHDIISWMPSGKSFSIHKPKVFTARILPDHFKSAKYSSFTRKLHRWGFMRHYRGEEAGAFYHDDFQKGRLDLVEKMSCYKPEETAKPQSAIARKSMHQSVAASRPVARLPLQPPALAAAAAPRQLATALEGLGAYQRNANAAVLEQAKALSALQRQAAQPPPPQDLNAAIEAEVSRRIEERISQAAASRLALLQQQASVPLQLQRPQDPPPFVPAWNQPGSNMALNRTALAFAAQKLYGNSSNNNNNNNGAAKSQSSLRLAALGEIQQRLSSLPSTNIQGAKTA